MGNNNPLMLVRTNLNMPLPLLSPQVHAARQSATQVLPGEANAVAAPPSCTMDMRANTNWGVATASYQVSIVLGLQDSCLELPAGQQHTVPCATWNSVPGALSTCCVVVLQVEGAWNKDGRTPSVWDTFSQIPGNIKNNNTGALTNPTAPAPWQKLGARSLRVAAATVPGMEAQ